MPKVRRVEWDGEEVTVYFEGSTEPFGEREFEPGTNARYMFTVLTDLIKGVTQAYEEYENR